MSSRNQGFRAQANLARVLATVLVVQPFLAALPSAALANGGGAGGADGGHAGGTGGTSSATGTGGAGGNGTFGFGGGGGGGGAGVTGGPGGSGTDAAGGDVIAGGSGGATAGANGSVGTSGTGGTFDSGGGGGGGAHGTVVSSSGSNAVTVAGGNGGNGGAGVSFGDASGGGGGAGGYGVVIDGSGLTYTNSATITGGHGGTGGTSGSFTGLDHGGNGGDGGYGVDLTGSSTLSNSGTIAGGNGGAGGATNGVGTIAGTAGAGGVGVIGSNIVITNSGSITGGLSGDRVPQASAITFSGGTNSLTLQTGSTISGNVVAFSSADTLALGGSSSASFAVSNIGSSAQFQGFGVFQKTGSSTWTLTGSTSSTTSWSIIGGTLSISSDGNLGSGGTITMAAGTTLAFTATGTYAHSVALNGDPTFDVASGMTVTYGGVIDNGTSAGTLAKTDSGTLVLTGANTYTGGTVLNAGTLTIANSSALGTGALSMAAGTTLGFSGGNFTISNNIAISGDPNFAPASGTTQTITGVISDGGSPGTVDMLGPGTLVLSGGNTYTGGTVVTGGTLQISGGGTLGATSNGVTVNGATLDLGGTTQTQNGDDFVTGGTIQNGTLSSSASFVLQNGTVSAVLAGSGSLVSNAPGTATVSGANTYTGSTQVQHGTLQIAGAGTLGATTGSLAVEDNGTLNLGGTTQTKNGGVSLGYAEGTTTIPGTIQNGTLASSGTFALADGTVSAVLAGSGGVVLNWPGTVTLSGANTYTGGTTVSAGTLQISGGGTLGNSSGATTASGGVIDLGATAQTQNGGLTLSGGTIQNGTLSSSGTFALKSGTISATLAGAGAITKTTFGTVTLSGPNSFAGGTTVSAGTLQISSGGTLGAAAGTTTVSGGILDLGATTQTQNGGLSVSSGTIQNGTISSSGTFALQSGVVSAVLAGAGSVSKTTSGTVTLSGANTYSGGTSISAGTLTVGNSSALGSGALAMAAGTTLGFSGGNFTIANNITISGDPNFAPASGTTQTISGVISDGSSPGTVDMLSPGTLILSGANTYTGGTTVSGGTLQTTGSGTLGASSGATTVSGGTLDLGGTTQTQNSGLTVNSGTVQNGTLSSSGVFGLSSGTISAVLAGSGQIVTVSGGTTILSGANTYTGGTSVQAGTLQLAGNGTLGSSAGTTAVAGGTLDLGGTTQIQNGGLIVGLSVTIPGQSPNIIPGTIQNGVISSSGPFTLTAGTVSAVLAGTGAVNQSGSGTTTLSAANSYSGGTTVSAGTLQLSGSGTLGAASGATTVSGGTLDLGGTTQTQNGGLTLTSGTVQNGTLSSSGVFGLSSGTISAVLAGSGQVVTASGGTTILSGANSYTGGTSVQAGTLQLAGNATLGSSAGTTAVAGGTLDLGGTTQTQNGGLIVGLSITIPGQSPTIISGTIQNGVMSSSGPFTLTSGTVSAALAGTGAVNQSGAGTTTLSGANTYSGGTTVSAGTLQISGSGTLGSNSGATTVSGGTLDLGGTTQTQNGGVTTTGGIIQNGTLSSSGTFTLQSVTISAALSGTGALASSGTVTLSGANTYTGGTTVSGGTLQGTTTSLQGNIVDNGNVTFNQSSNGTYAGNLSGTGSLSITGGGTVSLTGADTFAGGIMLASGATLTGTTSTILGNINDTGNLTFSQNFNGIYTGVISGPGSVTKTGIGTVIFNGSNTYGGTTNINAGTLEIGDAAHPGASLGTGAVNIASGAVLMGHGSIGGAVANTGTVAPGGTIGTLTVASYTQAASGTLQIEVSPTAASKLNVTGAANLAGAVSVSFDSGNYAPAVFDILHAGSLSGTFSAINGSAPSGFVEALTYSPTDVDLVLAPAIPVNGAIYAAARNSALLRAQQANTTILSQAAAGSGDPGEAIRTALAFAPSGTNPASTGTGRSSGWIQGTGDFINLNGSTGEPGFRSETGGIMGGIDRDVSDTVRLGIAAGYDRGSLAQSGGGTGTIETPSVAVYGRIENQGWDLDGLVGYALDRFHILRPAGITGDTATSGHSGQELSGALQLHTALMVNGITVQPVAGVRYVRLVEDGFGETGAGAFDATLLGRTSSSLQPFIGASAAETITTDRGWLFIPEAHLFYSRETENVVPGAAELAGTIYSLGGDVPARDRLNAGGRITAKLNDDFAFFAEYDAIVPTGNLLQQTVSLGLSYRF